MTRLSENVHYCSETFRMFRGNEELTCSEGYLFNFSKNGTFTLVTKEGLPLKETLLPLVDKTLSHLLWMCMWGVVAYFSRPFPHLALVWIAIFFLHLFLFGCRLTTLLLQKGLKPFLFPPLWEKLSGQLKKGAGRELLEAHQLQLHPGLLVNLALAQKSNNLTEAKKTLQLALSLCPSHPLIQALYQSQEIIS